MYKVLSISYRKTKNEKRETLALRSKLFALCAILLTTCYLLLATVPKVHADFSLGVYPPLTTITTDAPYDVNAPITIQNTGDIPVDLGIRIRPFHPSADNNGTPQYVSSWDGADAAIKDKISVQLDNADVTTLSLPPNASRTVNLHIAIPENEPDGEYYFSVIFVSNDTVNDQTTSSGVTGGIATHVILHIGNVSKPAGTISDFSTPFFRTSGPVPVNLLVTNTGSTFFAPKGTITIKNTFGQTVGAFELLPVNILKGSSRYIPAKGDAGTDTTPQLVWNEKVLAGIYSMELKMKFSDDGPFFDQTIYFVVVPWAAIIAIIGISLVSLAVILRVKRRIS